LPHTVVIVDESSMVSLSLMAKLLDAVRPSARLVLVGDPRQLASVEAGAVLGDIVGPAADGLRLRPTARAELEAVTGSAIAAVDPGADVAVGDGIVVLRRVHRFGGGIASVADAIDSGDPDAVIEVLRGHPTDVSWVVTDPDLPAAPLELASIRDAVLGAATSVVDAARTGDGALALDALRSVQVLCAHRRGPWGASWWRFEIERWLRSAIPGYAIGPWYAGRPLLVTENDYALGVFNGDTGVVIDDGAGHLRAVFDRRGEILEVRPTRLAAVDSLYAITIHKAQGSQFGSVVVVLPEPSSPILTRELLYTAVTRAQSHLTLVGAEAAIRAAVTRPVARASGLAGALWGDPAP
jgi:exodeoxyribonuclease V alpha subunit